MISVQVKLFAGASQLAGHSAVRLELAQDASVADLRRELLARYPQLVPLDPQLRFAVDRDYAAEDDPIRAGQEIAAIPPVSGG
jgi:molybdopterin converting factor subunit 1